MQLRLLIALIPFLTLSAWAQSEPDSSAELEQILKVENQQQAAEQQEDDAPEKPQVPWGPENVDPKELSDLGRLAPFNDVAVIQKRFLPKTERFELFPSVGAILNDVFFFNPILGVRAGYHFTEQYAVELMYFGSGKSERQVVRNIRDRGVTTQGLAFPQSYYGADFKWTPFYGKMGFFNKSVIPFDHYFSLGGGITQTNQKTSPSTLHIGTGQIYALSKWIAARWDVSMFWYQSATTVGGVGSGDFMNLHLTLGVSFFFPEAKYR